MNRSTAALRDLIETKLDEHWVAWSGQHPHLADAIDRTRLIDVAAERLREDPAFIEAIRQADIDEQTLARAAKLLHLVDRWARQVLPG